MSVRIPLLAAALVSAFVLSNGVESADFGEPAPFRAWDNYWCESAPCEPDQYGIRPAKRTHTGGIGWFPQIVDDGRELINGGIPQRGNLTRHLERVREDMYRFIPDADLPMHAVIDFEAWTPMFVNNRGGSAGWHGKVYVDASLNYTASRFPGIAGNWTALYAKAQEEFETAAIEFFVETLKVAKELRPKALWGYYGFPYAFNGECEIGTAKCGYENPSSGPFWKAQNDKLAPIWRESGALYPSVYVYSQDGLPYSLWQLEQWTRARGAVREAIRLSTTFSNGPVPVLPFYWPLYHNGTTAVDAHDLKQLVAEVYAPPLATQLIIWDGGGKMGRLTPQAFRTVDGPVFREAVAMAEACTTATCSGHGWCDASIAFPGWGPQPAPGANCTCYPGYSGSDCAQTLPLHKGHDPLDRPLR